MSFQTVAKTNLKLETVVTGNKEISIASELLASVSILEILPTVQQKVEFADRAIKTVLGVSDSGFCVKGYMPPSPINAACLRCTVKEEVGIDKPFDCLLLKSTKHRLIPLSTSETYFGHFVIPAEFSEQIIRYEHLLLNFLTILSISVDNTLRRHDLEKAEQTLNESESSLRNAQEIAKMGSWAWNLIKQKANWSENYFTILGFKPSEVKPSFELFRNRIHPDDVRFLDETYATIMKDKTPFSFELRLIQTDGTIKWIQNNISPVVEDDKIVKLKGVIIDITEHKLTEEALIKSETRFRSILNASLVPMALNNEQKQITFLNPAFIQTFGYTQEDIPTLEHWWLKAYPNHEYRQLVADNWQVRLELAKQTGAAFSPMEITLSCKNGTSKTVLASAASFSNSFEDIHLVMLYDITERKQAEHQIKLHNDELQKLNAEKDKFFSIIAHDLRSPFNGFLGLTQIMAEDLPSLTMDEIQKISVSMRNSASNLFRLLENLLEWARMKQGLIPFDPNLVELLPIIDESMSMILEPARNKGIKIAYTVPAELAVFADSNMLHTVIRNLVSNAVKFTIKGGKVSLSAKDTGNKSVEISVRDTGIGMSQEMVESLFRPDVQTSRKGTEGEPSSGLGLLLCKEFIEKHGGKLWVESEEGKGSTFYFTIPYQA